MTSIITSWLAGVRIRGALFALTAVLFLMVPRIVRAAPPTGTTPSSVTLAAAVNPAEYGQANTLTATMDATETGSIQFLDGTTLLGTSTIAGGEATLPLGTLTIGVHSIVAQYGGDATFAASSSSPLSLSIVASDTSATIASSSNPSTFGDSVMFTAQITTTDGSIPTGGVDFDDGATVIGTGTLDGTGTATFATSALGGGSHTIMVSYPGNSHFNASSASLTQSVDVASSSLTLSSTTNPSVFGQSVQIIATATAVSGVGAPTGTVTFTDGGGTIGTVALNGAGQAILTTNSLSVGTHSISAAYGGDTNFASSSTTSSLSQTVDQASTSTALMSSSNPSIIDASVTFTATVTATAPGAGTPSGTVTFSDGATTLGSSTLSSGVATLAISTLTVGTHHITAAYEGDTSFTGSSSSSLAQVVSLDGVTVALASSLNPSTFGTSVTFTATVSADDAGTTGTPTGTVTFNDGATLLGTGTLSGGVATLATSALTGGTHAITAVYGGDSDHASGSSASLAQVVDKAASQTTLASSHNPSVFGQSITFTATVTSAVAGTLTGTVTFADGATTLGTTALGSGSATFTTSALSVTSHSITATYNGDTNFASSPSTTTAQVVAKASTSTVVVSSSSPSLVGSSVTFTATVSVSSPGAGSPSGTVTFKDGTTTLGSGSVNGSGVATFSTSTLAAGSHTITAVYSGDSSFNGSTSPSIVQSVSTHGATLTLAAAPNPTVYGVVVVLTATLSGSSGTPTGTVTFSDGTTTLGSGSVNGSGVATFSTTSPLGAGTHTVGASYGGDGTYATATGNTSLVIALASTTTIISTSANPITTGTSVTFTAAISSSVAGMTGQVELFDGTTSLGLVAVANGAASFTTSTLTAAGHAMTATYKGDSNFAASTSTALTEKVSAPITGDGGAPDGGAIDAGDDAGPLGVLGQPAPDTGCGCRVPAESPVDGGASLLALVALGALFTRRRSKKR